MTSGRIRTAVPADARALGQLEAACFPRVDRCQERSWRRLLASSTCRALVAESDTGISGVAAWLLRSGSRIARLRILAVHPGQRRQGLARRLMIAGCARLPAQITSCSLEVRASNAAAIRWYRRVGFRPVEGLGSYYIGDDGGGWEDGLRMRGDVVEVVAALHR